MERYRRFIPYILRQWRLLLCIGGLTALTSAMAALQPWPLKILVDYALEHVPLPTPLQTAFASLQLNPAPETLLLLTACASLAIFALNSLLDTSLTWTWTVAGQRMVYNLARDLFHRLQRLSLSFHYRTPIGDSLSRLTTDTWCVYKLTDGVLISPAQKLFTIATLGLVAWQLHAQLAICALVTAPLMALATVYFGKRIRRRTRLGREAQSRLMSFVHQTLASIPIVQAFATENRNRSRYQHLAEDAVNLSQRGTLLLSYYGLVTGLITTAGTALIVYVGARQALAGKLGLGSFLVFLAYMRTLQTTAESLIKTYSTLKPIEASIDRVLEILRNRPDDVREKPGAQPLPSPSAQARGHVRLENVTFGYQPARPVLQHVELEAKPGQVVALVGPTGAGKSTLVSLIPRFFDPWEGRVLIDGFDARDVQLRSLRAHISIVLQEPFLFPMTVARNIAYGRPEASPAEIRAAAEAARADDFIRRLPQGYDTVIGERGSTLSGGERQRLAIARAILKDAPVLILDEPTSALDAQTESQLLEALQQLIQGRTTFIIAHRLSTIRRAHLIAVLEHGRIIETGPPAELLAARGAYQRLHAMQSQDSPAEALA